MSYTGISKPNTLPLFMGQVRDSSSSLIFLSACQKRSYKEQLCYPPSYSWNVWRKLKEKSPNVKRCCFPMPASPCSGPANTFSSTASPCLLLKRKLTTEYHFCLIALRRALTKGKPQWNIIIFRTLPGFNILAATWSLRTTMVLNEPFYPIPRNR